MGGWAVDGWLGGMKIDNKDHLSPADLAEASSNCSWAELLNIYRGILLNIYSWLMYKIRARCKCNNSTLPCYVLLYLTLFLLSRGWVSGWVGGWGKIENKDHLSPAEAETRAELGNIRQPCCFLIKDTDSLKN